MSYTESLVIMSYLVHILKTHQHSQFNSNSLHPNKKKKTFRNHWSALEIRSNLYGKTLFNARKIFKIIAPLHKLVKTFYVFASEDDNIINNLAHAITDAICMLT